MFDVIQLDKSIKHCSLIYLSMKKETSDLVMCYVSRTNRTALETMTLKKFSSYEIPMLHTHFIKFTLKDPKRYDFFDFKMRARE